LCFKKSCVLTTFNEDDDDDDDGSSSLMRIAHIKSVYLSFTIILLYNTTQNSSDSFPSRHFD